MKQPKDLSMAIEEDVEGWLKIRDEVERELSDKQGTFCCCGALATGLHERRCDKFQEKVNKEARKRYAATHPDY